VIDVSVVIGTRNQAASLGRTLASYARQTWPADRFEVVVVDSESADATADVCAAAKHPFALRYIRRPNQGKSAARNAGLAAAAGPVVLLTDADVTADGRLIERHRDAQRDYPGTVVVGQQFMVDAPDAGMDGGGQPVGRPCLDRAWRRGRRLSWRQFVTGNASLGRRQLLDCGGFDEHFRGYGYEDYELGYRLAQAGAAFVFDPGAINFHYHPVSFDEELVRKEEAGQAAVYFATRHPSAGLRLHLGLTPWNRALFSRFPPRTLDASLRRLSSRGSAVGRMARHLLLVSAFHRGAIRAVRTPGGA
jgi:glycosyltransferase involved in cell wall biosynthesis